ncbi:MAG: hypothetical protein ACXVCP_15110 [Bdellovibrio sp.]
MNKATLTIVTFLMSVSMWASAHPTNDLSLNHIGVGTELIVINDINFPAGISDLIFDSRTSKSLLKRCVFTTQDRDFDRVLLKGQRLLITKVFSRADWRERDGGVERTVLEINGGYTKENSGNIWQVECFFNFTIGEFKQLLLESSVADVKLAVPQKMQGM